MAQLENASSISADKIEGAGVGGDDPVAPRGVPSHDANFRRRRLDFDRDKLQGGRATNKSKLLAKREDKGVVTQLRDYYGKEACGS